jgi:hypothetical protein
MTDTVGNATSTLAGRARPLPPAPLRHRWRFRVLSTTGLAGAAFPLSDLIVLKLPVECLETRAMGIFNAVLPTTEATALMTQLLSLTQRIDCARKRHRTTPQPVGSETGPKAGVPHRVARAAELREPNEQRQVADEDWLPAHEGWVAGLCREKPDGWVITMPSTTELEISCAGRFARLEPPDRLMALTLSWGTAGIVAAGLLSAVVSSREPGQVPA